MLKTIREYGLLFAAFVTVIPCPALHCRPGTFWTYPLIFTLMLLSCLLASAAVFLFRRRLAPVLYCFGKVVQVARRGIPGGFHSSRPRRRRAFLRGDRPDAPRKTENRPRPSLRASGSVPHSFGGLLSLGKPGPGVSGETGAGPVDGRAS